jgi:hypothetical protein
MKSQKTFSKKIVLRVPFFRYFIYCKFITETIYINLLYKIDHIWFILCTNRNQFNILISKKNLQKKAPLGKFRSVLRVPFFQRLLQDKYSIFDIIFIDASFLFYYYLSSFSSYLFWSCFSYFSFPFPFWSSSSSFYLLFDQV